MTSNAFDLLTDADLIARTKHAVCVERQSTVELIALLAELDARRLYLAEGCASLFTYCTQVLGLSESAAYARITAARTARRLPAVLNLLAAGDINLTTISLLSAHLTEANHQTLLDAAKGKSKRDVERLVASLVPQPDITATVRKLPVPLVVSPQAETPALLRQQTESTAAVPSPAPAAEPTLQALNAQRKPPVVAPLDANRYLLRVTLSEDTNAKLERARSLCRHVFPDGNLNAIIDRALTLLVRELERTRVAAIKRPPRPAAVVAKAIARPTASASRRSSRSRHVAAVTTRAVWARDSGRCAFVGREGRCRETSFLELHHVTPFAAGGPTSADNLELRCRAHNQYEATLYFAHERAE